MKLGGYSPLIPTILRCILKRQKERFFKDIIMSLKEDSAKATVSYF